MVKLGRLGVEPLSVSCQAHWFTSMSRSSTGSSTGQDTVPQAIAITSPTDRYWRQTPPHLRLGVRAHRD
jgi:hypothetical protein